ncbi:hypothetical protein AAHC03_025999 [Spirometra sp. Aus1]
MESVVDRCLELWEAVSVMPAWVPKLGPCPRPWGSFAVRFGVVVLFVCAVSHPVSVGQQCASVTRAVIYGAWVTPGRKLRAVDSLHKYLEFSSSAMLGFRPRSVEGVTDQI